MPVEGGRANFVRDESTEDIEECQAQIEDNDQPSQLFSQPMSCKRAKMEKKCHFIKKDAAAIPAERKASHEKRL